MTDWTLAFVVHSTIWCGLAALLLRLRPNAHAGVRETIWMVALAASLLTPTAQVAFSATAVWQLPAPALQGGEASHHDGAASAWPAIAGWLWFAIAAALLLAFAVRLRAFHRSLRGRVAVIDVAATRTLASLSRKAGLPRPPRLSACDALRSPVALGVGRAREICVPTRALRDLDDEELRAMLGHELAHHRRGDTLRLLLWNALQHVFFFQPLFRLANRSIQAATEEQCDDWAAGQLNDRFAMASCLTVVAGWVVQHDRYMPAPCMAQRRSQLSTRVHRLTDEPRTPSAAGRPALLLAACVVLFAGPWLAPQLTPTRAAEGSHERGEHREHDHERGSREHRGEHR